MDIQKRVERKLMLHVASIVFLLYFFFAIDRGNIGFAALQMNDALGPERGSVRLGLGPVHAGLSVVSGAECRSCFGVWARVGSFAIIACAWGVVSTSTAFVPDQFWFLVNRFALGMAEAGFHAFMIYYISCIFPKRVRGYAVGVSFVAVPCSMIVASPLSGALLDVDWASFHGWQSLFILEGVPSVLMGLLCLKVIPDTPADAKFLTDEERAWLAEELSQGAEPVGAEQCSAQHPRGCIQSHGVGIGVRAVHDGVGYQRDDDLDAADDSAGVGRGESCGRRAQQLALDHIQHRLSDRGSQLGQGEGSSDATANLGGDRDVRILLLGGVTGVQHDARVRSLSAGLSGRGRSARCVLGAGHAPAGGASRGGGIRDDHCRRQWLRRLRASVDRQLA